MLHAYMSRYEMRVRGRSKAVWAPNNLEASRGKHACERERARDWLKDTSHAHRVCVTHGRTNN
jgi:hypothetical protein